MAPRREAEISLYTSLAPLPALFPHLSKKPSTATAAELLQNGCTSALYERVWNEKHRAKLVAHRRKVVAKEKHAREESDGAQRKRRRSPVSSDTWKPALPQSANISPIDLPKNFPSGSLLSSIHTHASHLLAKSHLLLPILTPEAPYLPAPILAHIDDFRLSIDAIDERKGFRGNTVAKEWDKTARVDLAKDAHLYGWKGEGWKAGDGRLAVTTKAKGWRDVEKKWEGSALIAIGMLMDLLASHAMRDAHVDPAFEVTEAEQEARAEIVAKEARRATRVAERELARLEERRVRAEEKALRKGVRLRKKAAASASDQEDEEEEMQRPMFDLNDLPPLPDIDSLFRLPDRPSRSPSRQSSAAVDDLDPNRRRSFASFLQSQGNSQVDPPVVSPPQLSDSDDPMEFGDHLMAGRRREDGFDEDDW